ncbi:MAG: hypothetical protein GX625_04290, partial [Clostridiaceae bacterium]|nr:hypothetical protein [Clostridiaceae bacterium]
MYRSQKRRRFNPRKFILFVLTVGALITVVVLSTKGKDSFSKDNLKAQGSAHTSNTATVSPSPSTTPEQVVQPTPRPTPDPMPEDSTDRSVLDVSWEDPAVFTGEFAFDDLKKIFNKKDGTTMDYWVFEQGQPVDYTPKDEVVFG